MKIFILLSTISCVFTVPTWNSDKVFDKLEEAEKIAEQVIRSHYEEASNYVKESKQGHYVRNVNLLGFSWANCAKGSDLTINKLSVAPDPIVIPGNVTIGLDATIATQVTVISSVEVIVKKKIFGVYIEVPCVDNFGSCTYNDFCNLLTNITCPEIITAMGFTCKCPFAAKDYEVPDGTSVAVPKLPIPASVENGDYDFKVTMKNGDTTLACYDFKASLKTAGYAFVTKK